MKLTPFQPLFVPAVDKRGILGPLLLALGRRLCERLARRAVLDELSRLDDRTLLDLGINRGDFASIADGSWRRQAAGQPVAASPAARGGAEGTLDWWPHH